jgi:hypothetical protein
VTSLRFGSLALRHRPLARRVGQRVDEEVAASGDDRRAAAALVDHSRAAIAVRSCVRLEPHRARSDRQALDARACSPDREVPEVRRAIELAKHDRARVLAHGGRRPGQRDGLGTRGARNSQRCDNREQERDPVHALFSSRRRRRTRRMARPPSHDAVTVGVVARRGHGGRRPPDGRARTSRFASSRSPRVSRTGPTGVCALKRTGWPRSRRASRPIGQARGARTALRAPADQPDDVPHGPQLLPAPEVEGDRERPSGRRSERAGDTARRTPAPGTCHRSHPTDPAYREPTRPAPHRCRRRPRPSRRGPRAPPSRRRRSDRCSSSRATADRGQPGSGSSPGPVRCGHGHGVAAPHRRLRPRSTS